MRVLQRSRLRIHRAIRHRGPTRRLCRDCVGIIYAIPRRRRHLIGQ